jgi:hypothetical protein
MLIEVFPLIQVMVTKVDLSFYEKILTVKWLALAVNRQLASIFFSFLGLFLFVSEKETTL